MDGVEVTRRFEEDTAVVRGTVSHDGVGDFIGRALGQVMAAIGDVPVVGPPFCRLERDPAGFLVEVGFPVERPIPAGDQVEPSSLPGGLVATVLHRGDYAAIAPAYAQIESWLSAHGYRPSGAPWESYLDEPGAPEPRTLVCWPCERADPA